MDPLAASVARKRSLLDDDRTLLTAEERRFGPGLYLHFPFCERKCGYCDFYVHLGDTSVRQAFLADLGREIALARDDEEFAGVEFQSFFLGGGTPSLLSSEDLRELVRELRASFRFAPDAEWTIEANPESLSPEKIDACLELGLDRISLGVQSANPRELTLLDRTHDASTVARVVREIRARGGRNVSVDLLYGVSGQSVEDFASTIETVLLLEPEHISAYLLTLEPRALLARRYEREALGPPPDEEIVAQYDLLRNRLAGAGLDQYETSNFARPGRESRHNQNYWVRGDYLGLGPSAHSHRDGHRFSNVSSVRKYGAALADRRLPREAEEWVDGSAALSEWIFLGLRRRVGLPAALLEGGASTGSSERLPRATSALVEAGLLERVGDRIRIANDKQLIQNSILVELLEAL